MYTTRPLSLYTKNPEAISLPPEGPNSGYLVIQDEEFTPTCFGLCKNSTIKDLPLPQNKRLSIRSNAHNGDGDYDSYNEVYFIPIINQPLSSNRYYAIKSDGRQKGEAYTCSKEGDKVTCCFCIQCIRDAKPRPFDPEDIYQQFDFSVTKSCLEHIILAESTALDGHPPRFLRAKGLVMKAKSLNNPTLEVALGLDSSLRARLPDLNFPSSQHCSKSVTVGKWYCPFIFINDGMKKDQVKNSVFYEMKLEQRWQRIFAAERSYNQGNIVTVDVVVPTEMVKIAGQEAIQEERFQKNDDRVVWFKAIDERATKEPVGLSSLIVERMMWEEERFGWVEEAKKHVKVVKDEKYRGIGEWTSFGCYVLVESFVLKRNDGSVVLTYDFKHTRQIRSKWE